MESSMILSMDGNESQRRNASNDTDTRGFNSQLYISTTEVDTFGGEVKRSQPLNYAVSALVEPT